MLVTSELISQTIASQIGRYLKVPKSTTEFRSKCKAKATAGLNQIFAQLGQTHDMQTLYNIRVAHTKDYPRAYDIAWIRNGRMHLAVESEFLYQLPAMLEDFEKLPPAHASLKVFIHRSRDQVGRVLPVLRNRLARYCHHTENEEYLVIQITDYVGTLIAHSFRVPSSGCLSEADINFSAVSGSPFAWW